MEIFKVRPFSKFVSDIRPVMELKSRKKVLKKKSSEKTEKRFLAQSHPENILTSSMMAVVKGKK